MFDKESGMYYCDGCERELIGPELFHHFEKVGDREIERHYCECCYMQALAWEESHPEDAAE